MKIVEMKCKNCGAVLKIEEGAKETVCQYCQTHYQIENEKIKSIQYEEEIDGNAKSEKIEEQKENKSNHTSIDNLYKKHGCLFYFIFFLLFPFAITYYVIKSKKLRNSMKVIILLLLWTFIIIVGMINEQEEKSLEKNPWMNECTIISDFKYYLDGDEVILDDYNGSDKKIKVCSTYMIDGKNYHVTKFSGGLFSSGNIYSVILPDGLISMPNNTLSNYHIKYVYIPSSLQFNDSSLFYRYFRGVKKIYYGGTKEEWKVLTGNIDRLKIDAEEIVYNATIEDLEE